MKVSFAAQRPKGSYALAIPVWDEDMLTNRLGSLDEASRTPLGFPHDFILEADANITGGATILPPPQGRLV